MTENIKIYAKRRGKRKVLPNMNQLLFCFMGFFSLALIIKNSDIAIEYMQKGLLLCTKTVIPSLFPFMVVSDIIVSSGVASYAGKLLRKPVKLLFGISGDGGCAVFLGTLCGFPIGAKSALSLYDMGKISKGELERILTFANNPSSAFIISAVGMSLFGNRDFGRVLYVITLVSAAIIGTAQNLIGKFNKNKGNEGEKVFAFKGAESEKKTKGIEIFTNAVTSSAFGMLKICAFVVFFSSFIGTLGMASDAMVIPRTLKAWIFSVCELTSGMAESAAVVSERTGAMLAAFAAGWSGLSVHFQIMAICSGRGISFKPYFLAKLFQGICGAVLMWLYFCIGK